MKTKGNALVAHCPRTKALKGRPPFPHSDTLTKTALPDPMPDQTTRDEAYDQGNTHLALGDLESAETCYRQAVDADPDFFDGWQALGMTLLKLKKVKEAIGCGLKTTLLDPDDLLAWTGLSQMYVQDGQIAEAEAAKANARILSMGGKVSRLQK